MGNCLAASVRMEIAQSSQNSLLASEGTSKTGPCSTPSNPTVPSYCGSSASDGLCTPRTEGEMLASPNLKAFMFDELSNATRNFALDGLVGEGRFGCVYKGWIDQQTLPAARRGSGMAVAVKKLEPNSFQGHKEWLTEVNYLGQLRHPNLVKLVGYCLEDEYLLLVYEFMPKGSLEDRLFRRFSQPLSWDVRLKIAIGAARGLSFLHDAQLQVIYRYFKASNILLDSVCGRKESNALLGLVSIKDFNPKLSDFGLAKDGPTGGKTHVSTQAVGTPSHAAPEYITTGRLSSKSDVYSFGVFLLELLSGRRSIDRAKVGIEQNLVDWARPYLGNKRKLLRIMDTRLEGQYPKKAARKVASLALSCLNLEAKARPHMFQVLAELEQLPTS